jgi:hypothetical protein
VTWAGTFWTDAIVNEAGLAYVGASLSPRYVNWNGVPHTLLARWIAERCATLSEALEALSRFDLMAGGANMTWADARGGLFIAEKVPRSQQLRVPEGSTFFHTNHPLAQGTIPFVKEREPLLSNSRARLANLARLVPRVPHTLAGLEALLRDHTEPGAICQHGQALLHTVGAYIIAPAQRRIWMTQGPPCTNEFIGFAL